jgi:hypothetical protein
MLVCLLRLLPVQALCPWLQCGHAALLSRVQALQLPQQRLADLKQQVDTAGVAQVRCCGAVAGGAHLASTQNTSKYRVFVACHIQRDNVLGTCLL